MKKNFEYFHLVSVTSPAQRKALLDTITNDQLRALTELTFNIGQGNIILTEAHKTKLRPHKMFLRVLMDPRLSLAKKREALCQKEPVVTVLLKAAVPQLKQRL